VRNSPKTSSRQHHTLTIHDRLYSGKCGFNSKPLEREINSQHTLLDPETIFLDPQRPEPSTDDIVI
jgi:hypothetical protein